jgi:hypothetical protein
MSGEIAGKKGMHGTCAAVRRCENLRPECKSSAGLSALDLIGILSHALTGVAILLPGLRPSPIVLNVRDRSD